MELRVEYEYEPTAWATVLRASRPLVSITGRLASVDSQASAIRVG